MITNRQFIVRLMLIFICFFGTGEGISLGENIISANKVPGQVESKARRLMHDLKKEGFEVSRGYFKVWPIEQCEYTFKRMGMCYGNNPAAPYVTFAVPPWPDEFVDPVTSTVWGPSLPGFIDVYRFDPREAIVVLGKLPPPASYFGEMTYLFTRQGTYDPNNPRYLDIEEILGDFVHVFFQQGPSNPERYQAVSSLSNPINNVVIERKSGSAFEQIRHIIITPDKVMDQAVRKAFARISVRDEDVFTEQIPSDMHVGLGEDADDFITFFRYANAADKTRADAWRAELPLVVLRVRDTRWHRQPETYPPVAMEERSAVDEYPLKPDLGSLLEAIAQRWSQPCAEAGCADRAESFIKVQNAPIHMIGPLCNEYDQDCLGDNWDASYQLLPPHSLDHGEIYAIAGTLGTETGNATYTALSINQKSRFKGVKNIPHEVLQGSANGYSPEVSNTDKLFLVYFTRNCSDVKDLTDDHCIEVPTTLIPEGDKLVFAVRDYIKPGTQRGPDSALILPAQMLQLVRP
ncbi:MAG: hypothetical protein AB9919_11115 [Geobacteraceae bacterium]